MILQVQVHVGDYVPMVTFCGSRFPKLGRTFDPMPWDSYATIQPVIQILGDLIPVIVDLDGTQFLGIL